MFQPQNIYDYKTPKSGHEEFNFFSIKGRISKNSFWARVLFSLVVYGLCYLVYKSQVISNFGFRAKYFFETLHLYILPLFLLLFISIQGAKRMHDSNKSGWYFFVPFYNLYLLMLEGSQGNNEYGIDPSPLKNIQYFDELEKIKFKPGNTEKKDNKRLHYVLLASGVIVLLVFILALSDYSGTSLLNNHSISIGGQRWMDKNLDVSEFSNGDLINEAATNEEWILAANEHRPAWCYYNNDSSNHRTTGRLYNWYAVIDPRGLAPKGWHIPKKNEWEEFIKRLEENHNNSAVIKSIGEWGMSSAEATGSTHFDALPTGCRDFNGLFIGGGCYANFWASNFNYVFQVSCMDSSFSLESHSGKWGFSVRCLQN